MENGNFTEEIIIDSTEEELKKLQKIEDIDYIENEKIKETNIFYFIPLIFIIVIIPLITHGKIIELPMEQADFWKGGIFHVDFFSYYKSTLLIIMSCVSLLLVGHLILNKKIAILNEKRYYIPIIIYVVFVLLSTILSKDKNVSILGFIEMYQGMSVLLSYILLLFLTMNLTKTKRDIKILIYSISALTVLVGILGLSQYFGNDFLQTSLGKWLITPEALRDINLNFSFGKYTIYATMYNTNFVGSFGALVLPIAICAYLQSEHKIKTIIFFIASLLAYSTWLGCNSRAGYIGVIIASVFGIIIFRKILKQKNKKILRLLISFITIALIFNIASSGRVGGQFSRLNLLNEIEKMNKLQEQQKIKFKEISVNENTFTIKTTNETLIGEYINDELVFKDEKAKKININKNSEGIISFTDKKYENYTFLKDDDSNRIECTIYKKPLHLYITKDNNIKVISLNNKLTIPIEAPSVKLFEGRETFASNRGYIWSRSIPMLKDTILIGYGPDSYCMVFPQEDYVGRFNTGMGMTDIVVDKPHNMYLQTAINTGIISLVALLIIWFIYLVDSLKLYLNGKINSFEEYAGVSLFLSVTGYLGAGIFNDNIVSVAPLFWIILGLGVGINSMNKIDKSKIQC